MKKISRTLAEELYGIYKDNERVQGEVRVEWDTKDVRFKILDEKDIYVDLAIGSTFQINLMVDQITLDETVIKFTSKNGSSIMMEVID